MNRKLGPGRRADGGSPGAYACSRAILGRLAPTGSASLRHRLGGEADLGDVELLEEVEDGGPRLGEGVQGIGSTGRGDEEAGGAERVLGGRIGRPEAPGTSKQKRGVWPQLSSEMIEI